MFGVETNVAHQSLHAGGLVFNMYSIERDVFSKCAPKHRASECVCVFLCSIGGRDEGKHMHTLNINQRSICARPNNVDGMNQ